MFSKCASTLWLIVDEGFHVDEDKGSGVIVVWSVHVGAGGNFGVCFRLAEQQKMLLGLGNHLAPEVLGKRFRIAT